MLFYANTVAKWTVACASSSTLWNHDQSQVAQIVEFFDHGRNKHSTAPQEAKIYLTSYYAIDLAAAS